MTALLGLLAIAGYQNRDKLAEMLGGAGAKNAPGARHASPDWGACSAISAGCWAGRAPVAC